MAAKGKLCEMSPEGRFARVGQIGYWASREEKERKKQTTGESAKMGPHTGTGRLRLQECVQTQDEGDDDKDKT